MNTLDSVMISEGKIMIMTTNNIEVLEGAILRGGRIDLGFYFGPPGGTEIRRYHSFYPEMSKEVVI